MISIKYWGIILFLTIWNLEAQNKKAYKIHTIAFYNLENLFDTIDNPNKFDESSPIMEIKGNRDVIFKKKIKNMARVIADIGKETTHNSPVIMGVSEIENQEVLEAIINDSSLIEKDYGIIHYDSPDARGIDVALLYQKKWFVPTSTSNHELRIYDDQTGNRTYTRDQLLVSGILDGEPIYVLVNHWPSRRGSDSRSNPKRIAAAKLSKQIIDSIQSIDPYAKLFIMGDLNDNPTDPSVKSALKAQKNKNRVGLKGIYNPFENFYKKGAGTTAYRDNWSLFDQIMLTNPLLEKNYSSFQFYQAGIFNKPYLITQSGPYKGYPFRSWGNEGFTGGFSDHLPVFVYIIKEIPSTLETIPKN